MTTLSFEAPDSIALRVPAGILRRDVNTLSHRPMLSLRRRGTAVRRLAKYWCSEQDRIAAERAIKRYKTALRANHATGIPYRLARRVQDEMYGERIGRGPTLRGRL